MRGLDHREFVARELIIIMIEFKKIQFIIRYNNVTALDVEHTKIKHN